MPLTHFFRASHSPAQQGFCRHCQRARPPSAPTTCIATTHILHQGRRGVCRSHRQRWCPPTLPPTRRGGIQSVLYLTNLPPSTVCWQPSLTHSRRGFSALALSYSVPVQYYNSPNVSYCYTGCNRWSSVTFNLKKKKRNLGTPWLTDMVRYGRPSGLPSSPHRVAIPPCKANACLLPKAGGLVTAFFLALGVNIHMYTLGKRVPP